MASGLLLVDKPEGMTSHDVVGAVRRHLGRKDVGHAGTLDPMATGLLVLLIGQATKLSDYILNGDKSYLATVRLGVKTDTGDITGEVTQEQDASELSAADITSAAQSLSGELELKVPQYSAIKVKGKKLYEKARKGESFDVPTRKMSFNDLKVLEVLGPEVRVTFRCSKGSYVRSWGETLGEKLACGGTLSSLRRTDSAPYSVTQAIGLQDFLDQEIQELGTHPSFIAIHQCLPEWPTVKIDGLDEKLISNGQISRRLERYLELEFGSMNALQGVKVLSKGSGQLISLLSFEPPLSFKIRRVFPKQ